jgi:transcriptional regulator with XRE-family HTH domain
MDNQKTLGEYIRQLRGEKELSLRELAAKLDNLSAAFLSDVELGRRYPSDKVLLKMARVLGTTFEELKRYDNRPPIENMKKAIQGDMRYSLVFRQVIDNKVSVEKLMEIAKQAKGKKKEK